MDPRKPPLLGSLTPFSRLLFSVLLMVSCFSLTFLGALLLAIPLYGLSPAAIMESMTMTAGEENIRLLEYFQVAQSFGLFIIPPLLAGWFFGRNALNFMALDRSPGWIFYLLTLVLMFVSLPLINWLIGVNEGLRLPEAFRAVEEWMRSTEEAATRLTDAFMEMPTAGAFLFNLFMVAALPALGEELVFRGLFQRLLREWLGNIHLAILFSAILFSAMHMQFYGFLPRMALGLMFGYLFHCSGSLWIPILAHFLNNGAAVVVEYLAQSGIVKGDYEQFGATPHAALIAGSALLTLVIFFILRRRQAG